MELSCFKCKVPLVAGEPGQERRREAVVRSGGPGYPTLGRSDKVRLVPHRCPQCRKVRAVQALER